MNILREALKELKTLEEEVDPKDSQIEDVTLEYKNLDLTLTGEWHRPTWGYYGGSPGYYDEIKVTEDFEYEADGGDVFELLCEWFSDEDKRLALEEDNVDLSDDDDEKISDYIELHFDKLVERYMEDLKVHFKDRAIEAAEEYYGDESNFGPDPDEYDDGPSD